MSRWLYRYEAKGIQGYVLASSRLKEIAGASALVEDLGTDADAWAHDADPAHQKLVAAAGNAMYLFSSRDAVEGFAAHWPVFCEQKRPGLQLVQAWCELAGDAPTPDERKTLFGRIEASRNLPSASLPEAGPLAARAGRSGLPAVDVTEDGVIVDAAARARLRAFAEDRVDRETGLDFRVSRDLPGGWEKRARFAHDLEGWPAGYLAIVHADGNGIGRFFLEGRVSFGELGEFSSALGEATTRAMRAALDALDRAHRRPHGGNRALPFRPVVLGGDDLTVICLASDAIAFTESFLAAFERETAQALRRWTSKTHPKGFTACAGIAMVRRGFPFHVAYDLAEALCTHAKRAGRGHHDELRSSLMFHRVTTAAVADWDEIAREERACEGGERSLIGGPWHVSADGPRALGGLRALAKLIAKRAVPRGPVREWMSIAQRDVSAADRHWRRVVEVLRGDAEGRRIADDLAARLHGLGAADGVWRRDGSTPIADAIEWVAVDGQMQGWTTENVQ